LSACKYFLPIATLEKKLKFSFNLFLYFAPISTLEFEIPLCGYFFLVKISISKFGFMYFPKAIP